MSTSSARVLFAPEDLPSLVPNSLAVKNYHSGKNLHECYLRLIPSSRSIRSKSRIIQKTVERDVRSAFWSAVDVDAPHGEARDEAERRGATGAGWCA